MFLLSHFFRFFLPWACAGCRTPLVTRHDSGFCEACWLKLPRIDGWICRHCGVPLKDGGSTCFHCRSHPPKITIRSATVYRGPIRSAIHRFKYSGRKTLADCLARLLEQAFDQYSELHSSDVLVPVPLHPKSQRERGYNQSLLLSEALSVRVKRPVQAQGLFRVRSTTPQFQLSRTQRRANLIDAFQAPAEFYKGCDVLLIDDLCTTAVTLEECAKALKRAGARHITSLVLARDV